MVHCACTVADGTRPDTVASISTCGSRDAAIKPASGRIRRTRPTAVARRASRSRTASPRAGPVRSMPRTASAAGVRGATSRRLRCDGLSSRWSPVAPARLRLRRQTGMQGCVRAKVLLERRPPVSSQVRWLPSLKKYRKQDACCECSAHRAGDYEKKHDPGLVSLLRVPSPFTTRNLGGAN